jgi:hypothetical protein
MCSWCTVACTGVVLNTVRERATTDSKENKQAGVGSRHFTNAFSVRRAVLWFLIGMSWRSIYTRTTGRFSNTLYAQHPVTTNLRISPPFSPTISYRDANSVLLLAHLCTSALIGSMRRTLHSKLFTMSAWKLYSHAYIYNGNVRSMRRFLCD